MKPWTFAALGCAIGITLGWIAGRAAERTLWALDLALLWWRETRYWAGRAIGPIAAAGALATLTLILIIWL